MLDQLIADNTPERARKSDAGALSELIVIAGDGLPFLIWEGMREDGESLMDVGHRRASRKEGGFSYTKADVVRGNHRVISAMVSYPISVPESPEDIAAAPAVFRPLRRLENRAIRSWYINALATFPDYRGKGAATALLRRAETRARAACCTKLSLITGDVNPARQLYEHVGFKETARDAIVKEGWTYPGREWILYEKPL